MMTLADATKDKPFISSLIQSDYDLHKVSYYQIIIWSIGYTVIADNMAYYFNEKRSTRCNQRKVVNDIRTSHFICRLSHSLDLILTPSHFPTNPHVKRQTVIYAHQINTSGQIQRSLNTQLSLHYGWGV